MISAASRRRAREAHPAALALRDRVEHALHRVDLTAITPSSLHGAPGLRWKLSQSVWLCVIVMTIRRSPWR